MLAHTLEFDLYVRNVGTAPADDVEYEFTLPDDVVAVGDEGAEDLVAEPRPSPPEPPEVPQPALLCVPRSLLGRDFVNRVQPTFPQGHFSPPPGYSIEQTRGGFLISGEAGSVLQGRRGHLGHFALMLRPGAIKPFQINYTLHARTLPNAVTGSLTIKLRRGS